MRALLVLLILLCLLPPAARGEPPAVMQASPALGAAVTWGQNAPPPGSLVRLRLRGEVLQRALASPDALRLTAGGQPVAFRLDLPQMLKAPERHALAVQRSTAKGADLQVELDRGVDAPAIDKLELTFAAADVLAGARPEASLDGKTFKPAGPEQLLCQRAAGGGLIKLTTLDIKPGPARYLRVLLRGLGKTSVVQADGYLEQQQKAGGYSLRAVLAPMQSGEARDSHLWPLLFGDDAALITSLKFDAGSTGLVRRAALVRLAAGGAQPAAISEFVLASGLKQGSLTRTELTVRLLQPVKAGGLALLIYADQPALQLKSATAEALDGSLVFTRPAGEAVTLVFDNSLPAAQDSVPEGMALEAGTISELSLTQRYEQPPATINIIPAQAQGLLTAWWRFGVYCAGALVLLLLALRLLRRPRPSL